MRRFSSALNWVTVCSRAEEVFRFCSSSTTISSDMKKSPPSPPAFDPEAFAREQERRRANDTRKAFWSGSSSKVNTSDEAANNNNNNTMMGKKTQQQSAVGEEEIGLAVEQRMFGRDAVELVERVQAVERSATREQKLAASPMAPPLRGKKAAGSPSQPSGGTAAVAAASSNQPATASSQAIDSRLQSLYNTYSKQQAGQTDAAAEARARRREQLKFRDIDYDLDRVRLERDFFQWWYYIKYGNDYAIDCELERELRYFPEHAGAELRKNVKFMVGPAKLAKLGAPFPTITNVTRMSSTATKTTADGKSNSRRYDDDSLTQSSFKMPTVVFVSQFAHEMKEVQDIQQFYVPLMALAAAGAQPQQQTKKGDDAASSAAVVSNATQFLQLVNNNPQQQGKLDLIQLKTVDFQSSMWMRKWLTRVQATKMDPLLADRTYVGNRLLRNNFAQQCGLRNFGAQYVLLVDHRGRIRWMSTGPPTEDESKYFVEHLRTLMRQHMVAKSG